MSQYPALVEFLEGVQAQGVKSPYLHALVVDLLEERMEDGHDKEENLTKAVEVRVTLARFNEMSLTFSVCKMRDEIGMNENYVVRLMA